jgi:hypothetical protein
VLTQSGYAISPEFATGRNRSQIGSARKPRNEARLQEVRGAALLDNLTACAPLSIVVIVAPTASMCPSSSAAMFAIRS